MLHEGIAETVEKIPKTRETAAVTTESADDQSLCRLKNPKINKCHLNASIFNVPEKHTIL